MDSTFNMCRYRKVAPALLKVTKNLIIFPRVVGNLHNTIFKEHIKVFPIKEASCYCDFLVIFGSFCDRFDLGSMGHLSM